MKTWNEFFSYCREKTTIGADELNKLYGDKLNEVKTSYELSKKTSESLGKKVKELNDSDLEKLAVARVHAHLIKHLSSKAEKFVGIAIGLSRPTDYGAKKAYDNAIKLYNENHQAAVDMGFVNSEGKPVYPPTANKFKIGKLINLDDKSRTIFMLVKKPDETVYTKAMMNISLLKHKDKKIPLFAEMELRGIRNNKSTPELLILNDSDTNDFNVVRQLEQDEITSLLITYHKDKCKKLKELDGYHTLNELDQNRMVIVKANVSRISLTNDNAGSNVIDLVDMDMDLSLEDNNLSPAITCWLNKSDVEVDFMEGAVDVMIVGKTNKNKNDGKISLEAYGFYCSDMFKVKSKPSSLKENIVEEQVKEEDW